MAKRKPITLDVGQRFERLVVLACTGKHPQGGLGYSCKCDCGVGKIIRAAYLNNGRIRSCGCLKLDAFNAMKKGRIIHGQAVGRKYGMARPSSEYNTWASMIARCVNPNRPEYPRYGGRGIKVCDEWRFSFLTFLADMGPKPLGTSLDRLDNEKGYFKGNCAWRSAIEQGNNRRITVRLSFKGETLTPRGWSERTGLSANVIRDRLRKKWPIEKILLTPAREEKFPLPRHSAHYYCPVMGIAVSEV